MEPSVAQARIEHFFPTFVINTIRRIPEGWDSFAFEVNGDHIVRFAKRPEVAEQYAQEAAILSQIAALGSLLVPRFTLIGRSSVASLPEFVGYAKLPGQPLSPALLTAERSVVLARQLGAWLAQLHALPLEHAVQAGYVPTTPSAWHSRYQALYDDLQLLAWPLLDPTVQQQADQLWQTFLDRIASATFCPVLLHNDLNEDHLLCDLLAVQLRSVIDWGDAQIGDPALDFAALLYDFGPGFAQQTVSAYGQAGDQTFWARINFYAAILRCHEILFGLRNGLPQHIEQGVKHFGSELARFWPFS